MVQEIMADELERIVSENKVVFVDCFATWCHPCKILGPVLEKLDEKYAPSGFKVVKIDVDKNQQFSMENRISGVPSILVYRDGQRVVFDGGRGRKTDKLVGVMPEEIYVEIIEDLLEN